MTDQTGTFAVKVRGSLRRHRSLVQAFCGVPGHD